MNINISSTNFGCILPTSKVRQLVSAEHTSKYYTSNLKTIEQMIDDGTVLTTKTKSVGNNIIRIVSGMIENIFPTIRTTISPTLDVPSKVIKSAVKWAEDEVNCIG